MSEVDRPLNEEMVERILLDQFGLRGPARRFREGEDNEIFVVGDRLFRFPKRAEHVWRIEREIAMMPVIAGKVRVRVPTCEWVGRADDSFPYPFLGYRLIPGIGIDRAARMDRAVLAEILGGFLSDLHAIDPFLVPPHPDGEWRWEPLASDLADSEEDVRPHVPPHVREAAAPYLAGGVPAPRYTGAGRLLHGDMCPDHLIADRLGRLQGIIDIEGPVGDAVFDFVGLVSTGGLDFADQVRRHYILECGDDFEQRLVWASRVQHLRWLGQAATEPISHHQRSDLRKHQRWVLAAFAS